MGKRCRGLHSFNNMNFLSIIIYEYLIVAALLIYFIQRDCSNKEVFFGKKPRLAWMATIVLALGMIAAIDARFIEVYTLKTTAVGVQSNKIKQPVRLAFLTDLHVGTHKKLKWVKKVVKEIEAAKPDAVLIGGDFIVNFGTTADETNHLDPLKQLTDKYPVYAAFGNHEYGLGWPVWEEETWYRVDKIEQIISRLTSLGVIILRNDFSCLVIREQKICFYGADEWWSGRTNFDKLAAYDFTNSLIVFGHNPDIVLAYPDKLPKPDLILAGHSHGGQVRLPLIGPIGNAGIALDRSYYRGLNEWKGVPIFTTVGSGESGGPIRFLNNPSEIAVITLTP